MCHCLGKACLARWGGGAPQDFDINISNKPNIYFNKKLYIFKLHSFQKHSLTHKQTYFTYEKQIIG